ncbi:hypothetical protein B0T22DRAFT_239888 [Podospora appendiculata]|uniref:Secreted protein n=1 Tax=Podospora appendiculata TaxID=314037 RepID=A0AAE1CAX3_9PEZI|nr:hypothetical protein B0T22DRAFT_239888 [Podospora appendiculata]
MRMSGGRPLPLSKVVIFGMNCLLGFAEQDDHQGCSSSSGDWIRGSRSKSGRQVEVGLCFPGIVWTKHRSVPWNTPLFGNGDV